MMGCCHGFDFKEVCEKYNCKVDYTDKGININLEPKDQSKVKSLHALFKACKDLCDCEC